MFSNLGSGELIIIGIIIFFLFGGKKLKELARGMGESSLELKKLKKEFNKAVSGDESDLEGKEENKDSKGSEDK